MSRRLPSLLLPPLLLLSVALYFVDLGGSSIWDANEAFYVETPREMLERGDYISPTFNYEPRLNKPVLSYWIVAGFYQVLGVSVAAQRLPIALGALVLVAVAFFLAREAWPDEPAGAAAARTAALWAAVGLAVSPRLAMFARRIFIDVYVSMFMALTLLFFALAERYPHRRRLFLALMYGAVGLGVLTKGPIAALLPGLVFALYLTLHRELRRVREMMLPAGLVIVLAIVVPWYVALYRRDGWTYIAAFLLGENFARFTEGLGVSATRGPAFYLPVIFSDAFPISIFLLPAAAMWVRNRRAAAARDTTARVRALLWLWILTIVIFFSFSAAKQDLYIFPIVPAVAALGGVAIERGLRAMPGSSAVQLATLLLCGFLVLLGGAVLYLLAGTGAVYAVRGAIVLGMAGVVGGLGAGSLAWRRQVAAALIVLLATVAAMNWVFVLRVLPSFEVYKPAPAVARVLSGRLQPGDVVATYNVALPSLVYYLRRQVHMAYDPAPIRVFLESAATAYVVLSKPDYDELRLLMSARTCVVSTHPTFDVKLRNVLARDPVPELLLVTNRCPGA